MIQDTINAWCARESGQRFCLDGKGNIIIKDKSKVTLWDRISGRTRLSNIFNAMQHHMVTNKEQLENGDSVEAISALSKKVREIKQNYESKHKTPYKKLFWDGGLNSYKLKELCENVQQTMKDLSVRYFKTYKNSSMASHQKLAELGNKNYVDLKDVEEAANVYLNMANDLKKFGLWHRIFFKLFKEGGHALGVKALNTDGKIFDEINEIPHSIPDLGKAITKLGRISCKKFADAALEYKKVKQENDQAMTEILKSSFNP